MQDSKIIEEVAKFQSSLRRTIMRTHAAIERAENFFISPFVRFFDSNTKRFSNSGFGIDLCRDMLPGFDKYLNSLMYQEKCDFCQDSCPDNDEHKLFGSNRPICDACLSEEE